MKAPNSEQDFSRDWRRHCQATETKLAYLQLCAPDRLPKIFKVEVSSQRLAEIVQALAEGFVSQSERCSAIFAAECLVELTKCGRFALNARLMAKTAKASLQGMLKGLRDHGIDEALVEMLVKEYGVSIL